MWGVCVRVYGTLFWVDRDEWGKWDIILGGWGKGVTGALFWVGGGGCINISGVWGGWVGMSGGEWGWMHCLIMPVPVECFEFWFT